MVVFKLFDFHTFYVAERSILLFSIYHNIAAHLVVISAGGKVVIRACGVGILLQGSDPAVTGRLILGAVQLIAGCIAVLFPGH